VGGARTLADFVEVCLDARGINLIWRAIVGMKTNSDHDTALTQTFRLTKLTLEQVKHIDEVLASLGEYGEIHLIIQHGELRYINKVESFSARKSEPKK
jgi:hypothetical protein